MKRIIIIALIIIIAALGIWYSFSSKPLANMVNFSEDGNVAMNNPGMKAGTWYLLYEKPGAPGLKAELDFSKIIFPALTQGMRVHVEGTEQNEIVAVSSISSLESVPDNKNSMVVKIYLYDEKKDQGPGGAQCSKQGLVASQRIIPRTSTPLADTIKILLQELNLPGVQLENAVIKNGVATLTFSDPQDKTSGGSCRVAILWAEIEATAKQFESVTSVRFQPATLFQP